MPSVAKVGALPTPYTDTWDWQLEGLCRGRNEHLFYHPDKERGKARQARANQAKAICEACPVIVMCRQYALTTGEPYGTWGGMTEEERRAALKRRAQAA